MNKIIAFIAAAIAAALLAPSLAQAQIYNSDALAQKCAPDANRYDQTAAQNYIAGIADMLQSEQTDKAAPSLCISPLISAGELKNAICKALTANPQTEAGNAAELAAQYLQQAYPCP